MKMKIRLHATENGLVCIEDTKKGNYKFDTPDGDGSMLKFILKQPYVFLEADVQIDPDDFLEWLSTKRTDVFAEFLLHNSKT